MKYNTGFASDFGVFEIGRTVEGLKADGMCDEHKKLCITLFSKTKETEQIYFELRDMLAVVTDDIKHRGLTFKKAEATHSYEHPKNLNEIYCDGVKLGLIGIANSVVSKKIDKKANIVFAEIDVEEFAKITNASISYEEPSRFPGIDIDLSFLSNSFAPINEAVNNANCPLIKGIDVTDIYVDESGKSITVRIYFAHPERTLTKEEVLEVVNGIVADLEGKNIKLKFGFTI